MTALTRRAFAGSLAALALAPRGVLGLGRKPYGGVLKLRLPWPLDGIDPHAVDDAVAALFGGAIADPLFALDPAGRPYPALAAALPEPVKGGTRVVVRPNLLSGRGVAMDARDVLASLARSERAGGAGLLAPLGKPAPDPKDAMALLFTHADPNFVAERLASPLAAVVPRGFSRGKPDGTGAFVADVGRDQLVLRRNTHAARGAALLDRIEIRAATDLKDALRAFEAGEIDVSWLGEFLHKPRPGAVKFDAGTLGWVVLRTGKDAGAWGAPGVAQKLVDALPAGRLSHLGLSSAAGTGQGDPAWGGEAAELLVVDGAVHLEQIAKELTAIFSRPGHELRVAPRPFAELAYRRERGRFALMLDLARPVGAGPGAAQLGVLTAESPGLARKPVLTASGNPRDVTAALSLGVVGQLRVSGAHIGALRDLGALDWGGAWRKP